MSIDLEQRLRDEFAAIADELQLPPMTFDDLVGRHEFGSSGSLTTMRPRPRQSVRTWLSVAATLVIVVTGLVAIVNRRTGNESDQLDEPPVASSVSLSEVTDLGPSDWVIASTLPDDVVWMYARIDQSESRAQLVQYGTLRVSGTFAALQVAVGEAFATSAGVPVEINGATWGVAENNGENWTATRRLASTVVTVIDSGPFDDLDRDVLAGLIVVAESELPSPPLGDPDRAVEVARHDLDGTTYGFSVEESNGYWCTWVDGSSTCGGEFDRSADLTMVGGTITVAEGADTAVAVAAGIVTPLADRVELEFSDGTTIAVAPTDLSGRFDRGFWIGAAEIPAADRSLLEVRAYDADGQLLATQTP